MSHVLKATALAVLLSLLLVSPAAAGASVDVVEGFGSVLAVARGEDFPIASLMRTDCAFVKRVERPDGSATETMVCSLSDAPVMIPAFQGSPPDTAFLDAGGPCIWSSDYWFETDGSQVYASSYRYVVSASGAVYAASTYPAAPLSCES
jgi:hypothetical protein